MEQIHIKVTIDVSQGQNSWDERFGSATMETCAHLSSVEHASEEMRRLVARTLEEVERQIGITVKVKALEEQKRVRVEIGAPPEAGAPKQE